MCIVKSARNYLKSKFGGRYIIIDFMITEPRQEKEQITISAEDVSKCFEVVNDIVDLWSIPMPPAWPIRG